MGLPRKVRMVEADQSQKGKVRENFKVTLLAEIVTREVTLAISARHQRRTSHTKTRRRRERKQLAPWMDE